ncbi:MAG: hypothetical protein WCI94_06345 [Rhodospirillales bacterium]
MKHILPPICALLPLLAGCAASPEQWMGGGALLGIGSIAVMGRTPVDAAISLATGRDCSVVRLEKHQSYCRPEEPPPEEPVFCTRSLARVTCWKDPEGLPGHPIGVADGPVGLTAAQEKDRKKGWLF